MSLPVEFLFGADAELQQIFNRFEDYRDEFSTASALSQRSRQFNPRPFADR